MTRLEKLRHLVEVAEQHPLMGNLAGTTIRYELPDNPVLVPVKDLIALLDVVEAAWEWLAAADQRKGFALPLGATPHEFAEGRRLLERAQNVNRGLRDALSALESEETHA